MDFVSKPLLLLLLLLCYLQDLGSHPFSIYMVFTGSRQTPSYKFTCYLHDLCSFALQIYSIACFFPKIYIYFWEHVKVQKSCKFTFYSIFLPFYVLFTVNFQLFKRSVIFWFIQSMVYKNNNWTTLQEATDYHCSLSLKHVFGCFGILPFWQTIR